MMKLLNWLSSLPEWLVWLLATVALAVLLSTPFWDAKAESYDNWKAPPPRAMPTEPTRRPTPHHHALVNEVVEEERLPYVTVIGHDLKVAINPSILEKYGLKSGDEISAKTMYEIIDADREFQKGLLR